MVQFSPYSLSNVQIRSDPHGTSSLTNSIKIVKGEGMPIEGTSRKGDLYIKTELENSKIPFKDREAVGVCHLRLIFVIC
jgi:DnaJ-class molecular chaperone